MQDTFIPKFWLRSPHVQTIFGSFKIRSRNQHHLTRFSEEMIVEGGNGVRLLGYYSPQPVKNGKGLIAYIHGWEGSSDSRYIVSAGKYMYERGYDIFRLNLRDHGNSHHLNEGLFHGALLEETFHAVRTISELSPHRPYFVVGFSLGGNFALRIALRHTLSKIPNLTHVIAISPALDPYKATLSIDEISPLYRYYFLNKWKKSLRIKQSLFPERYNFTDILPLTTCMSLTEAVMPYHPDFDNYRDYFRHYTLTDNVFADLAVPTTIIASGDDPIVPVRDIQELKEHRHLRRIIQKYGGHCGFIDIFPSMRWHEGEIDRIVRLQAET